MSLTKTLGQFIADLSPNRLPEGAERIARLGFIGAADLAFVGLRSRYAPLFHRVGAVPNALWKSGRRSDRKAAYWNLADQAYGL